MVYAVIFGGASSGSTLLLNLESVNLGGPFAHITLFGPVYLEGMIANLSTAVPFAVFIAGTGVLVAFVKPSQLFAAARKLPPFRPILSSLAIGWVQMPALLQATVRINRARKLRREKSARTLIPILETAIETSLALAQRLALLTPRALNGDKALKLKNVSVIEAGLDEINLSVNSGECYVVTGATGSGKSSLLLVASGVGSQLGLTASGEIATPGHIGFVGQQPRAQLFGPLVQDEIAPTSSFGLDAKMSTPVHLLSEGEAFQVSVISELQKQPDLLILDEPFAGLDADSARELVSLLGEYLQAGGSVLLAEHRPELLAGLGARVSHLSAGKLLEGELKAKSQKVQRHSSLTLSDEVLVYEGKSIGYQNNVLIEGPRLRLRQSEIAAITGRNGAGKTSLLNALTASSNEVVMVPERVNDFFVTTSLGEELDRADQVAKVSKGFTQANLASILGELPNLQTHPRDLSAGSQLALAIAMQLSHKPRVLVIDEPARGFDAQTKAQVIATLECVRETGCAIAFASHDAELISELATTIYRIADNQLQKVSEVMA
jgi:energy-coupling factor transport system ATP-binding protein